MEKREIPVRQATAKDAPSIARLLHDFNTEYSEPTPPVEELTEHARRLLGEGDVVPDLRGRGIGRALLTATIEFARAAGATDLNLNTGETDTAARALYESMGFTNREGGPEGPPMLFYEREL